MPIPSQNGTVHTTGFAKISDVLPEAISSRRKPARLPETNIPRTSLSDADDEDIEVICDKDRPALIPEGGYEVGFVRAERKARLWGGQEKIFLHFRITQLGGYLGIELFMSANLPANGKFSISSKYLREWALAAGKQPRRHDRLLTKVFKGKVFLAAVRTVKQCMHSSKVLKERDPSTFYSVVDHLIELRAGG